MQNGDGRSPAARTATAGSPLQVFLFKKNRILHSMLFEDPMGASARYARRGRQVNSATGWGPVQAK
jgi:hypothetical protein